MTPRERNLALLVGGTLFLLMNVVLLKFCMTKYGESRDEKRNAEDKLRNLQVKEMQRGQAAQRDTWLNSLLVPIGDSAVANKSQREYFYETAKKHQVIIESFQPGVVGANPSYTTLSSRLECKGKWDQVTYFLNELQSPENMTVLESLELKVDPNEKTQLRAAMTVGKWYAPGS